MDEPMDDGRLSTVVGLVLLAGLLCVAFALGCRDDRDDVGRPPAVVHDTVTVVVHDTVRVNCDDDDKGKRR